MKYKTVFLLASLVLLPQLLLPAFAGAKLYTWTDRNGVVRRTYYPPPPDQVGTGRAAVAAPAPRQQAASNTVELYVTAWCPYCKKALSYFQAKGVPVTVYDIEKDKEAARRKQTLDSQGGVPFALINGTPVHGYAPDRYEQILQ